MFHHPENMDIIYGALSLFPIKRDWIFRGDLSGSTKIQARYGTRRAAPAVAATAKPTAKGVLRFGRQKACWNSMVVSFGHDLQVIIHDHSIAM